jgi:hypothetical protein
MPAEFEYLGYDNDVRDPLAPVDRVGAFPAVILPTFNKQFGGDHAEFWDQL